MRRMMRSHFGRVLRLNKRLNSKQDKRSVGMDIKRERDASACIRRHQAFAQPPPVWARTNWTMG